MRTGLIRILPALLFASAVLAAPLAAQNDTLPAAATTTPDPTIAPLRRIGGGVSSPRLLTKVDPQFSEQARKEVFSGIVLVNLIVDTNGLPRNVHILRGVGMGLDESAVTAVKQYTFKPAMEDGNPVPVELNVEVRFQIGPEPRILHSVPLELTDEVRQNHLSGIIMIGLTIDEDGNPRNVYVARGFGMGMDERAIEAVKQYKFEPFRNKGGPVARSVTLELKFDAK